MSAPQATTAIDGKTVIYRRAVVHLVVPTHLPPSLYRTLRDWFDADQDITVVVERRAGADRRQGEGGSHRGRERRSGTERRASRNESTAALERLDLPWSARRHAHELKLILSPVPVHAAGMDREGEDCIERALAGEQSALDELYLHHYDRIRHQVEHAVGDRHAAGMTEDIFRVAFERLLDPDTDTGGHFGDWLSRLAAEMCRGHWHVR